MIDFNIGFALEKRTNGLVDKLYSLLLTSNDFKLLKCPAAYRQRSIRIEATTLYGFEDTNALEILTTPCLKVLHLDREIYPNSVIAFLQRSRCSLEEFRICAMYVDNTWQIPELKGIKKFHWEDPRSFPDGVYWLTNRTYTNIEDIFPQLDTLYVDSISFGLDIDVKVIEELTDMMKSRLPPVQPQLPEISDSTNTVHFLKFLYYEIFEFLTTTPLYTQTKWTKGEVTSVEGTVFYLEGKAYFRSLRILLHQYI
ncbi:hypothetical protein BDQ17DRAFT_1325986 [Cyathus striatus]|nr:hypothetical protein BDQ17DRAFT_1325986 [Cyathus striatus]